jgi:hypothetical protein
MGAMSLAADAGYEADWASCPERWRFAFDAATTGRTNLLQDMFLGMNAHINYDLPLCTVDTMRSFGDVRQTLPSLGDAMRADVAFDALLRSRYYDFLLINQIAWESIDLIQQVATKRFSRLLGLISRVERAIRLRLSKAVTAKVIADYRDRAWGHTLLLLTAWDPQQYETVKRLTSEFAMDAAALVAVLDARPGHAARLARRRHVRPDRDRPPTDRRSPTIVSLLAGKLDERSVGRVAERALRVARADFERLLLDYPPITLGLVKVLARRARAASATDEPLSTIVTGRRKPGALSAPSVLERSVAAPRRS